MPGIIINHPNGSDVYAGVPKDYNGKVIYANINRRNKKLEVFSFRCGCFLL